jgi:hypothetical protein
MRMFAALTAIVSLLGVAGSSQASQLLATPAIYGSVSQRSAQCNLGNFGTRDIPVTGFDIVDESGNAFPVNRGCGSAVPAGFICQIFAPSIPSGQAVACTATVSNGDKVRGTLLLFDNTGTGVPLRAQALR